MNERMIEVSFNEPVFDSYIGLVYSIAKEEGVELLIVGGAPRELLLHRKPKDIDFIVISGSAQSVPLRLHKAYDFFYPVLFEKFGTYRTGIQGEKGIEMEFIPIRAQTVADDLALRDFTINTLTMGRTGMFTYRITDTLGRAFDAIDSRTIQTPIEPERTIKDDPLRIMRAIRFSCTLDMVIEGHLEDAIKKLAYLLDTVANRVAVERIRDELFLILLSGNSSKGIRMMKELGIVDVIMPELLPTVDFDQRSSYHKDELFTHSLAVMDKTRPRIETRLAGLFHDTGKPHSMQVSPDRGDKATYYGHQDKSAELFKSFSNRLKLPNHIANTAEALIKRHMINYTSEWKDSTIRKFIKNNYDILDQLLDLYRADSGSLADPSRPLSMVEELVSRINRQQVEQISRLESPLDGNEIQKLLDIPPGPKIGEIKKAVVDAILEGTIEPTKPSAEAFIKQMYTASKGS